MIPHADFGVASFNINDAVKTTVRILSCGCRSSLLPLGSQPGKAIFMKLFPFPFIWHQTKIFKSTTTESVFPVFCVKKYRKLAWFGATAEISRRAWGSRTRGKVVQGICRVEGLCHRTPPSIHSYPQASFPHSLPLKCCLNQ